MRIICVPPDPRSAPDDDWRRALDLSSLLAHDHVQAVLRDRPVAAGSQGAGWRVIVVPTSIDADERQLEADGRLAEALNAHAATWTAVAADETIDLLRRAA